jgi:hypothetical protein
MNSDQDEPGDTPMNKNTASRKTQVGHFATAVSLALMINAAVAGALLHTPTEGQRYLAAAVASAEASSEVATSDCVKSHG